MSTNVLSQRDIQRNWHLVDVKDKILGRVATEIVNKLTGKNKVHYVPYLDTGDYVVVTNAALVKVTGKKPLQKKYVRHSGYPGGLKSENFTDLLRRRPEEIVRHAVKGMLPKTKLGHRIIKKLHVFPGDVHPFGKQVGQKELKVEEKNNG